MDVLFGGDFDYGRWRAGARRASAMGLHLAAGTLNQAALARGRAAAAAACWVVVAALLRGLAALAGRSTTSCVRVEVGYFGAALVLSLLLAGLYRRSSQVLPGQTSTF